MKGTTRSASSLMFLAIETILAGWFLALPLQLKAENNCSGTQGQNGVYNPTCNNGNPGVVGSSAFIDASMFVTSPPPPNRNFCGVLNWVVNPSNHILPATGAVIDARGLNSGNTSMTCSASPWAGISNPPPSVILLPATTTAAPIVIPSTWILPPNTRLIGEGSNITSSGFTPGTTLQAQSGFTSASPMISFGQSSLCTSTCAGISVENLTLDGQGQFIHGIDNAWSQESSYVDRVGLYRILGTGLSILGNASNSGPYSNIIFDLGGNSGTSQTVCASINGTTGTQGIHGLTCISESNDPPAAVLRDSSNNSIEDVRIVGFNDGSAWEKTLQRRAMSCSISLSLVTRSTTADQVPRWAALSCDRLYDRADWSTRPLLA